VSSTGGLNIGGQSLFGNTANKPSMFGNSTGMFNTGSFGMGSTFPTGTGLGTSVNLGGIPLLGGLVWLHSSTELLFYVCVSVHHNSILYKEPTRCNFGSIVY